MERAFFAYIYLFLRKYIGNYPVNAFHLSKILSALK